MKHFLEAPWLTLGSRLERGCGETARRRREPVEIEGSAGRVTLVRRRRRAGGRCERRRVARVLSRWREVDRWWEEGNGVDRFVFEVLLCGGAVVHLARERRAERRAERPTARTAGWFLVGVAD